MKSIVTNIYVFNNSDFGDQDTEFV